MSTGSECELVCVFLCPVPRSLCVDALIELSDENADWKLSFDEFLNCLKPSFNPPEKSELTDTWPLTPWLYDDNIAHYCWHHTFFFLSSLHKYLYINLSDTCSKLQYVFKVHGIYIMLIKIANLFTTTTRISTVTHPNILEINWSKNS